MNSLIPAARASSIVYWMSGLSTSGRIYFGTDLVAGRNLVPNPATGSTALVTLFAITPPTCLLIKTSNAVTACSVPNVRRPVL